MVALKVCLHAPKHATSAVNQHRQGPICSLFPFLFIFFLLSFSLPPLFLSTHLNHELGGESESTSSTPTQFSLPSNTLVLHSVYVCALKCVCMSKGGKVSMAQLELQSSVIYFLWLSWQQETGRDAGCWRGVSVCVFVRLCVSESRDHPLHHKQHQMH